MFITFINTIIYFFYIPCKIVNYVTDIVPSCSDDGTGLRHDRRNIFVLHGIRGCEESGAEDRCHLQIVLGATVLTTPLRLRYVLAYSFYADVASKIFGYFQPCNLLQTSIKYNPSVFYLCFPVSIKLISIWILVAKSLLRNFIAYISRL